MTFKSCNQIQEYQLVNVVFIPIYFQVHVQMLNKFDNKISFHVFPFPQTARARNARRKNKSNLSFKQVERNRYNVINVQMLYMNFPLKI